MLNIMAYAKPKYIYAAKNSVTVQKIEEYSRDLINFIQINVRKKKVNEPQKAFGNITSFLPVAVKKPTINPNKQGQNRLNHIGGFGGMYSKGLWTICYPNFILSMPTTRS